jgi:hypothetical protein
MPMWTTEDLRGVRMSQQILERQIFSHDSLFNKCVNYEKCGHPCGPACLDGGSPKCIKAKNEGRAK